MKTDEYIGYNSKEDVLIAKKLINGMSVHYAKQHSNKCAIRVLPGNICNCDGYHTFDELYQHRIELYINLCKMLAKDSEWGYIWCSKRHSDGSSFDGWFILGIDKEKGRQITYHLPLSKWDETNFAETLDKAPEFDGHTSDDVLERLKRL